MPFVLAVCLWPFPAVSEEKEGRSPRFRLDYAVMHGGLKTVVPPSRKNLPKLGLAFSGGGAKAAAAIGILKVLENEGIPVFAIAGTSMGALVGGLYAAGYGPDEIERLLLDNWEEVFQVAPARAHLTQEQKEAAGRHILEFNFRGGEFIPPLGLTVGQKLDAMLAAKTLAASFEAGLDFNRLKVPFRAVATDIETGETVVLDRGLLHDAIRASAAIPLVFQPVDVRGRLLVDGMLAQNIPVDAARSMDAEIVLAVDSSAKPETRERLTSLFEIMSQAVTIQMLRESQRQASHADLVITVDTSAYSFKDFERLPEIIKTGEEAARAALPRIRELMRSKRTSRPPAERFTVAGITVAGNKNIPADTISSAFSISLQQAEASEDDILEAMAAVFRLGYFSDVSLQLTREGNGYNAALFVKENPVVHGIRISGNTAMQSGELMAPLDWQLGQTLNVTRLNASLDWIIKKHHENGYLLARVERAGMGSDGGILEIALYEGRIDSIAVSGRPKTKLSLIRREIRSRKGAPLNFDVLARDIQHLYALDYFESLSFDIRQSPKGGVDLIFKIKEKAANKLRLGIRYDLEDGFTGLTDVITDNLTGRGIKLYLNTRYGNYTDATLGYSSPIFLRSYFMHTIQAYYRKREYSVYEDAKKINGLDVRRMGAEALFGYELFRFGDTHLRYRYSSDTTTASFGTSPEEKSIHIGSLAFLTTIDTRDSSVFPHAGVLFNGVYETADRAYGSSVEYIKTGFYLMGAIPLAERHTLVLEGSAGIGSGDMPYNERFGIGGADYLISTPLLGFHRREFTGANEMGASAAYRWKIGDYPLKIIKAVYLGMSVQAANVWESRMDMSTSDLRSGAGIGLYADTIIGPVRLDLAAGEGRRRMVYFSAGFDF